MACQDCLQNCDPLITDKCVKYTGPDIEALGICSGDSLYEVDAAILEKLQEIADGSGITLNSLLTECNFITSLLAGKDKTVENVVQALVTAACQLKEEVDELSDKVDKPFTINGECLDLPSNSPTRDQVLQSVVTKLCAVSGLLETVASDYVKATDLCSLVESCIGDSDSEQEYTKMPKYVALPYHGPLSVFDNAGKGIAAAGYDKVYLCVGQTVGTFTLPDYRGRSPIGANTNVVGGALDNAVNPALAANAGYGIVPGTKKGAYTDTLTTSTMPSHTHAVNDPGHSHTYNFLSKDNHPGGNNSQEYEDLISAQTSTSQTGITLGSTGGGQPHNNTHPVIGCSFIMYIP